MMLFRGILVVFSGLCYGLLSSAGVFTVLAAVGLIPRFSNQTHTANRAILYEEAVIFGAIFGCVISIFQKQCQLAGFLHANFPPYLRLWGYLGEGFQIMFGTFSGMFVGCLAIAIAEMLDSIPVFARRISFRHGIGLAVLSMAAGKLCGSLAHFLYEIGS